MPTPTPKHPLCPPPPTFWLEKNQTQMMFWIQLPRVHEAGGRHICGRNERQSCGSRRSWAASVASRRDSAWFCVCLSTLDVQMLSYPSLGARHRGSCCEAYRRSCCLGSLPCQDPLSFESLYRRLSQSPAHVFEDRRVAKAPVLDEVLRPTSCCESIRRAKS